MADSIVLLPDHIANQIAAGEVIQRPASAVKELLENAVDAGATQIRLIVNDSGKSLLQVIDNGQGMSETDARTCFERHATSKIQTIEDLFQIRTMGFRGEALASIAAVSQVELKTKTAGNDTGTYIEIENSVVLRQEPVAATTGTSIAMKNLFFNVPARRNFLKSNAAELKHIIDEFTRVALAFPGLFFSMTSNGQEIFHLEPGNLKQRILQLLGNSYNAKLVTVKEETDYLNIYGFAGKPETAKKTRGDQYFFVNNRFIKSPYLNHAVMRAYQEMIPADSYPMYVLFIDLDPAQVDVNVHPTKQEIKFEDEKIVYAFVQAAVKHALAQFSITPTLDFELDATIQQLPAIQQPFTERKQEAVTSTSIFRGFTQKHQAHLIDRPVNPAPLATDQPDIPVQGLTGLPAFQLLNTYIVISTGTGFILIHQQAAHERIRYEQLARVSNERPAGKQKTMFPLTIELGPADASLLGEISGDLDLLGYVVEPFGKNTFVLQAVPSDADAGNEKKVIESLLEAYKNFSPEVKLSRREKLVRAAAKQQAIKTGTSLTEKEIHAITSQLFACEIPNVTPDGHPTFLEFKKDQLEKLFRK